MLWGCVSRGARSSRPVSEAADMPEPVLQNLRKMLNELNAQPTLSGSPGLV